MLFTAGAEGVQVPGERESPVCAEFGFSARRHYAPPLLFRFIEAGRRLKLAFRDLMLP